MKFCSLPSQVADHLKAEIAKGRWQEWLPGERTLAESLQVSRRSLSTAIDQLKKEGVIRSERGRGNRILQAAGNASNENTLSVGLLTPEPLEDLRPGASLWVNSLQVLLSQNNGRLTPFYGHKYFTRHPANALRKLTQNSPKKCWVLTQSTHETQAWFEEHRVPCVLAGTRHADVNLPDVDFDAHALCFHAANTALSLGHRQIALLLTEVPGFIASEVAAEAGFREAFSKRKLEDASPIVVWHHRSRDHLLRILERLFHMPSPPTAILTTHGMNYLTVTSYMTQLGLKVPDDVSLISRTDDVFLDAILPTPTRYRCDPQVQAGRLFKMIVAMTSNQPISQRHIRIEPRFIRGESLAAMSQSRP